MTALIPPHRCTHCGARLPEDASKLRRYCSPGCQSADRNAHRREVTAWKKRKAEIDARRKLEQQGQLSLDPRPLDDLLPEIPPMPTRRDGAA